MHLGSFFLTFLVLWYPDWEREARTEYSVEDMSTGRIYVAALWCLLFCSLLLLYWFLTFYLLLRILLSIKTLFSYQCPSHLKDTFSRPSFSVQDYYCFSWYCTEFILPVYCPVLQHHEHCLQLSAEHCDLKNLLSSSDFGSGLTDFATVHFVL